MLRVLSMSLALLVSGAPLHAADALQTRAQILERTQSEVSHLLGLKSAQLDVDKPLWVQGADELDMVEIIMRVEEVFGVEIPDDAVGGNQRGWHEKLNVRRLADIVFEKKQPVKK
jgi:acyl carrier protein